MSAIDRSNKPVLRSDRGRCAVLTLNRPEKVNAISDDLLDELDGQLDTAERDESRALILTGNGRGFCAGSDLSQRHADPAERIARMHQLVQRLLYFRKPIVAALHGPALGGGLELALPCTFRVASADARLGLPEVKLALMPVYAGTQLLPRLIGEARALEMMLSGDPVTGARAFEIGLINRVVQPDDDLLRVAEAMANTCCDHSLVALQAIQRAVRDGGGLPLQQALAVERQLGQEIGRTADAHEGVQAFLEKRLPIYNDRPGPRNG